MGEFEKPSRSSSGGGVGVRGGSGIGRSEAAILVFATENHTCRLQKTYFPNGRVRCASLLQNEEYHCLSSQLPSSPKIPALARETARIKLEEA